MSARRCSICGVNWPIDKVYEKCPECEQPTDYFSNAASIPAEEAKSRKAHADFERYYEEREDGPPLEEATVSSPPPESSERSIRPGWSAPPSNVPQSPFPPARHVTGWRGDS